MQSHPGIGVAEHFGDVFDGDTAFVADSGRICSTGGMCCEIFFNLAQARDFLEVIVHLLVAVNREQSAGSLATRIVLVFLQNLLRDFKQRNMEFDVGFLAGFLYP